MNNNPRYSFFGERLKELRQRAGLTQEELAEKIGSDAKTIDQWEMGVSSPGLSMFVRLMQILPALEGLLRPLMPQIEQSAILELTFRQRRA